MIERGWFGRATRLMLALVLGVTAASGAAAQASVRPPTPPDGIPPRAPGLGLDAADAAQTRALDALRAASRAPLRTRVEDGQPRMLQLAVPAGPGTLDQQGRTFVDTYARGLWRLGPNSELILARTDPGTGLASFRQRYRGLPVLGAALNVLVGDGSVRAAVGTLMPGDGVDIEPGITAAAAVRYASGRTGGQLAPPQLAVRYVHPPGVRRERRAAPVPKLVWLVPAVQRGRAAVAQIDAHTGEQVASAPMDQESAAALDEYEAEWYDANSNGYDEETECQGDVDGIADAGDDDALFGAYAADIHYHLAWFNARRAYVFFYDRFSRVSYDNGDAPFIGYNESSETGNAMWSGACETMNFTAIEGRATSDTAVHEVSHGVTQFTSGLDYSGESGALNESFSDVMTAISDPDGDPWLVGEDRVDGTGAIRNMANPPRDEVTEMIFPSAEDSDVHQNSGVGNKAAFLLSEGGIHPERLVEVEGIGRAKAGRVVYAASTSASEHATYDELRDLAYGHAYVWASLGMYGFTDADVCSVRNAYHAVGAGDGDADCDGVGNSETPDNDGDGVEDRYDNCMSVPNPAQTDTDNDDSEDGFFAVGDACDSDDDNDEVPDADDNCPTTMNDGQEDLDGDGIGNACDDSDGDGELDVRDNCPDDYNPGQEDSNGDGFYGDACDPDEDGDGVPASQPDNCPNVANADQSDADGDFYGDACDPCPTAADPTPAFGFNGQPLITDSDGDGQPDECDSSYRRPSGPWLGGIGVGREPQPGILRVTAIRRTPVPLITCPAPCAEVDDRPFLSLTLDPLPDGVTALVTDDRGFAWARSRRSADGSLVLRFTPRGDRSYFLTFLTGGFGGPEGTEIPVTVRQFGPAAAPVPPADVAIDLVKGPQDVVPGGTVTYSATVTNEAFADAAGVEVQVSSQDVSFEAARLDAGTIPAGGRRVLDFTAQVPAGAAAPITVTAKVTSATIDSEPANDTDSVTSVVPLSFGGFQPPIDAPPAVNTGRTGRTYPVKFRVTDAGGAVVSNLEAVESIRFRPVECGAYSSDASNATNAAAAGGTGLRFEDGRFVFNWSTPAQAGCYTLLVALADGEVRHANVRLRS